MRKVAQLAEPPLTLTLSPAYRGEGTRPRGHNAHLNIAMVSQYLPSGSKIGSGYQAHYMANAMTQRGHHVTMFSLCGPSEGALYETVVVPTERPRTFRFAWNLRKLDLSRFDVLHAHGDDYWLGGSKKPSHVRTMHGSCLAETVYVPGPINKARMLLLGLSEVLATLVADHTACVSRNTTTYYPWVKDVVVNGVDLAAFHPSGEKEINPAILFVGTYGNRKRGHLLADAFTQVIRPAIPNARLWMVCGDAPPADGIDVLGRLPLEKLTDLYRRAWIFCLPSSYEGFGVPYIEAMASGTPVVATPNVGAREVLAEGKFGVLTSPKNLGAAILRLLRNEAERERLRTVGLERAQLYSWDKVAGQYEQIYAEVIARRVARAARP
jgi:glycosyltransferase involved in cell wall biosynthesis